jgi:hypothetical protein
MSMPQTVKDKLVTYEEMLEMVRPIDRLIPVETKMGEDEFEFLWKEDKPILKRTQGLEVTNEYGLSPLAFLKACSLVGISEGYANKFTGPDRQLLVPHLNYWFNKRSKRFSLLIDPDSGDIAAFNPDIHHNYNLGEVLQQTHETLNSEYGEVLYDKTFCTLESGMHFGAVLPRVMEDMNQGDLIAGGIHVRDSRLGKLKLRVSTYHYRLVCLNGMISAHDTGFAVRQRAEDYKMSLEEWLHESIQKAIQNLEDEFRRVRNLQNVRVSEHSSRFAEKLFRERPLPRDLANPMREQIDKAETLYDMMNVFTQGANRPELSGDPLRIEQIQMMGGRVAAHREFCETCHSELT